MGRLARDSPDYRAAQAVSPMPQCVKPGNKSYPQTFQKRRYGCDEKAKKNIPET
jgi:hypothetical protein